MASLLKIDGSLGEGGGQLLRIALSLSALFGIPVEIDNIRAGRPKPGLDAQHLKGVELVKEMCNANVTGAYLGSTRLEFWPGSLQNFNRELHADTQTAGCISLLAQVALPCALFSPGPGPITLFLKGGTNVAFGPQIEYLTEVFRPLLRKFGADFDFTVLKRGYFPKGGGEVRLWMRPVRGLNAVTLSEPGQPVSISGWAYVAGSVNISEANQMSADARKTLQEGLKKNGISVPPINIENYREDRSMAVGNGAGLNIVCRTSGDCILGGSGLREGAGIEAANQILEPLVKGACVDDHAQDQMVILMILARGRSRIQIGGKSLTTHTETAIKVAELMLGDRGLSFQVSSDKGEGGDGPPYFLECEGLGLVNSRINNEL